MTDQRTHKDDEATDDSLLNDDLELLESDVESGDEPAIERGDLRNSKLDMRQRIEEKLEERRLMKELNEYEFFDIDDEDTLH